MSREDPADYTFFFQADAEDHMHFGYLSLGAVWVSISMRSAIVGVF